ncbi:MAG: T9SS type A sorting domain-containing protein [bacterium]|nr:T9SS type A sorting domain-containing protein [bacterium]
MPYEITTSTYPNPFNPTTTISFDLPSTSPVTLRVFNTLGQQIAELANETFTAGHHEILFDGSEYPSGIYFYSFSALRLIENGKLLLLK